MSCGRRWPAACSPMGTRSPSRPRPRPSKAWWRPPTGRSPPAALLPGVSYSTEDPTGILSSDFRMHGFDGAHVCFTIDGTRVNDTGNYAVYPGEHIVSKLPSTPPLASLSGSGGSYGYRRFFGEYDTGALGPTGARSYLSFNYAQRRCGQRPERPILPHRRADHGLRHPE